MFAELEPMPGCVQETRDVGVSDQDTFGLPVEPDV